MGTERPTVSQGDWISIGNNNQIYGVVSSIYDTRPNVIEIVHLNSENKPLFEDVMWDGDCWKFTHTAISGGYAKLHKRLKPYVDILITGRDR